MVKVHLITGNKGNVGKSAWSAAMIEYYRYYGKGLIVIDSDSDSQTLSHTYKSSVLLSFSDDPSLASQPDMIFQLAFEESQKDGNQSDVLVDLPAGGEKLVNRWLEECGIGHFASDAGITFFKWWVCDSDPHSIELFEESIRSQPTIKHVFLKNLGRSNEQDWLSFDKKKSIQSLIKKGEVIVSEIPRIDSAILKTLRENRIQLNQVADDKNYELTNVTTRLRVNSWLLRIRANLEKIIVLQKSENPDTALASHESAMAKKVAVSVK
jgi:hypothetical protein